MNLTLLQPDWFEGIGLAVCLLLFCAGIAIIRRRSDRSWRQHKSKEQRRAELEWRQRTKSELPPGQN